MSNSIYKYICAIASSGSITRAAELLYVSQPALSKALKAVEKEIGAPIFQRMGRRMIPTEVGEVYIKNASTILNAEKQMHESLRAITRERRMGFLLCCQRCRLPFVATYFVPAYLSQANRQYLDISDLYRADVPPGMIKITCMPCQGAPPEGQCFFEVARQEHCLAVSADSPLLEYAVEREGYTHPYISAANLRTTALVSIDAARQSGRFARQYLEENGIDAHYVTACPSASCAYSIVAAGHAAAFLPDVPPKHLELEGRIRYLSVRPAEYGANLNLVFGSQHADSPDLAAFVRVFRKSYLDSAQ